MHCILKTKRTTIVNTHNIKQHIFPTYAVIDITLRTDSKLFNLQCLQTMAKVIVTRLWESCLLMTVHLTHKMLHMCSTLCSCSPLPVTDLAWSSQAQVADAFYNTSSANVVFWKKRRRTKHKHQTQQQWFFYEWSCTYLVKILPLTPTAEFCASLTDNSWLVCLPSCVGSMLSTRSELVEGTGLQLAWLPKKQVRVLGIVCCERGPSCIQMKQLETNNAARNWHRQWTTTDLICDDTHPGLTVVCVCVCVCACVHACIVYYPCLTECLNWIIVYF